MDMKTEFCRMQEMMAQKIIDERRREMAESIAQKQTEAAIAQKAYHEDLQAMEAAGIKLSSLEALDLKATAEADTEILKIQEQMDNLSQTPCADCVGQDVEKTFLPEGALVLTPSWVSSFSDDDVQDKLTGTTDINAQTLLTGGGCQNKYVWASGAGSGIAGTGVGKIQAWVDFGFWFKPSVSRFYSIRPLFRLRGYYIVKANDKWYNSKFARVTVSLWVNVHQYNWKGWNSVDVLNVGDDNINVNRRFDDDRYMYTSYLLGGGDWAYIRCTIGLYAYARGGGSYAKLDFSTGAANYLCVPQCYVL
jgi:hypothetical protein